MKLYFLMILTLLVIGLKIGSDATAKVEKIQAHRQAVFAQVFMGD
ncbi:MAG: hypothetical protein AB7K68_00285 [Bacteriovoracia bacterium]